LELYLFTEEILFLLDIIITMMELQMMLYSVFYVPKRYTVHAERECISKCPKKLISKATLLLVRETCGTEIGPCGMCQKLIDKYKIKSVICVNIKKN
jgi:cytidine deaminase